MVSWLTCIIGSSRNSRRKRLEISSGDHSSSSQVLTWATKGGWHSFGVFGRRAHSLARVWPRQTP